MTGGGVAMSRDGTYSRDGKEVATWHALMKAVRSSR